MLGLCATVVKNQQCTKCTIVAQNGILFDQTTQQSFSGGQGRRNRGED